MKNKMFSLIALISAFAISQVSFINKAFEAAYAVDTMDVLYSGPSSLKVNEYGNGYVYEGKLSRERGGFVYKNCFNPGHELNFDFVAHIDSGDELFKGNPQNRAYVFTFNEYPESNTGLDLNYNSHVNTFADGFQLEFRTNYDGNIVMGIVSHSERPKFDRELIVLETDIYPHLCSALWNKPVNGITASDELSFSMYPSDFIENRMPILEATHYTICISAKDENGNCVGEMASIAVDKEKISNKGNFITPPHLGLFVMNEPDFDKEIDVKFGIKNIENGNIEKIVVSPSFINDLKPGESRKITVDAIPFKGKETGNISYTYVSNTPDVIAVSNEGYVSSTTTYGKGSITVASSEGNFKTIDVVLFDDVKPTINIKKNIVVPSIAKQYSTYALPNFTAEDNWSEVTRKVYISSPYYKEIDCAENLRYLTFEPTVSGSFTLIYEAIDFCGNVARNEYNIVVSPSDEKYDWEKYGTYYSDSKLINDDGGGVSFNGEVGDKNTYGIEHEAGIYNKNSICFVKQNDGSYTDVSFSMKINYHDGVPIINNNETEYNRYFMLNLVEASENGSVGNSSFGWGTAGIHLLMGRRSYSTTNDLVWYELRAGSDQLSRQHTTVIDPDLSVPASELAEEKERARSQYEGAYCGGLNYLPWFKEGDARKLAQKFNRGEWFDVQIKFYDSSSPGYDSSFRGSYYTLKLNTLTFRIPAKTATGSDKGFSREAFLGIKQVSSNGTIPFDISISQITNGNIQKVEIDTSNYPQYFKVGDRYQINASSIDNNGLDLDDTFEFISLNEKIVTVDDRGFFVIKGVGSTKIKVKSKSSQKSSFFDIDVDTDKFEVKKKNIEIALQSDYRIEVDTGYNNTPISFTSSNPRIVAALNDGTLQAVGIGEADITVSYLYHIEIVHITVVKKAIEQPVEKNNNGLITGLIIGSSTLVVGAAVLSFLIIRRRKKNG